MSSSEPIRVLHVVTSLRVGGIQTWLRNVRQRMDRDAVAMDFAPYTRVPAGEATILEMQLEEMGSHVFVCARPDRPWQYARQLAHILRTHGPYDVVHAHLEQRAGLALRVAQRCGVPIRIAHAHNDYRGDHARAPRWWRGYLGMMRRWMNRHATLCLACSDEAGRSLYGPYWQRDERYRVLPYGIDLSPFHASVDRSEVRRELGLPEDVPVIGHVGRFDPQKNHAFLLQIMAALCQQHPTLRLLLAGDGRLRPQIEREAQRMGLSERVVFAGVRSDVPRLMMGAMDGFLLPSFYEGLPVVGIEAQAAGLPCLCSDTITGELETVPGLIQRVPLDASPQTWAQATLAMLDQSHKPSQVAALEKVAASPLSIDACVATLAHLYGAAPSEDASPEARVS